MEFSVTPLKFDQFLIIFTYSGVFTFFPVNHTMETLINWTLTLKVADDTRLKEPNNLHIDVLGFENACQCLAWKRPWDSFQKLWIDCRISSF